MKLDLRPFGLAALAGALVASAVPAAAQSKIAIINIQGAIITTKDGGKAREAMRVKYESRAKDLEARNGEVQKLREQFSKGANTMSTDAREKLSRDIDDKQKKLQWDSEDLNNEMEQEQGKLVNEIGQRMIQVIDEYAKGQAFSIVLDVSGQQSPVLWAASGIEITQQIVELYDKKFGADAPAAAPAPAGTTPGAVPGIKPSTPLIRPPAAAPKKPAGIK